MKTVGSSAVCIMLSTPRHISLSPPIFCTVSLFLRTRLHNKTSNVFSNSFFGVHVSLLLVVAATCTSGHILLQISLETSPCVACVPPSSLEQYFNIFLIGVAWYVLNNSNLSPVKCCMSEILDAKKKNEN